MTNSKQLRHKIMNKSVAVRTVAEWKSQGEKVVFTNGVFDLLHKGHIDYLSKAADLGTKLVMGLNSDASVKTLNKGPARPIKDQDQRATILAALFFVDAVIIFDEETPLDLIKELTPNVLVKGGDYDPKCSDQNDKRYIVGSDHVKKNGGKVEAIAFLPGYSTTSLEQKILDSNQ